jgi:hypothetical protein
VSQNTGILSPAYSYQPLAEYPTYREVGGELGKLFGKAIGARVPIPLPGVGSKVFGEAGEQLGSELANLAANTDAMVNNFETFLAEISDWQSWASMMSELGVMWW